MQVKDGGCVKSPFKTFTRPHDGAKKKGKENKYQIYRRKNVEKAE